MLTACSDFILRNAFQVTEFGFHKQWCWTFFVSRRSPDCDWHFLFSHVIFCSCFFNGHSIASFSHLSIDGLRMFAILGCKKWTYAYTVLFGDILGTITPKKINKTTTKQNKRVEEVAVSTVGLVDLVLPKFTAEARWLWNSKVFGEMMQFFEEIMSHVLDLWGTLKPMGNFLWISMTQNPAPKELVDAIVLHWETQPSPTNEVKVWTEIFWLRVRTLILRLNLPRTFLGQLYPSGWETTSILPIHTTLVCRLHGAVGASELLQVVLQRHLSVEEQDQALM